ncbi:MAG TPA: VWA domain-containing protein [Terriglobales bacterium]|nr:VWA domain-containing protein [Terriglobales bacterium]
MRLLWTALAVLWCACAWAQAPGSGTAAGQPAPAQKQENIPTFRADVNLVNVYVTVADRAGAPVGGLTEDDFQLFEDEVPQKISVFARESELPLSIVVALDTSLSTRKDLQLELAAARDFVKSILRPQDRLALYQFSQEVQEVVPFTSDMRSIDQGLKRVHVGAATALYDAIYLGSRALSRRQGRKVMVVITDGGDTMSQVDYQEALRQAQIADTLVYSIIDVPIAASAGRNTGGEHALIQIANDTGGKYYYAVSDEDLKRAFQKVSEELRTQYLLGYYPLKRLTDSDYRRIEVRLKPDAGPRFAGLSPRHRAGYYTSKAE